MASTLTRVMRLTLTVETPETKIPMSRRIAKIARNPRDMKSLRDENPEAAPPRAPVTTVEVAASIITLNPVRAAAATVLTTVIRITSIQRRETTETRDGTDIGTSHETPDITTSPATVDHDDRHILLVRAEAGLGG